MRMDTGACPVTTSGKNRGRRFFSAGECAMPLVTVTLRAGKSGGFKSAVLEAVHNVLIEILLSVGRSVKIKKKILSDIMSALVKSPGLNPENVMVCFKETQWENW